MRSLGALLAVATVALTGACATDWTASDDPETLGAPNFDIGVSTPGADADEVLLGVSRVELGTADGSWYLLSSEPWLADTSPDHGAALLGSAQVPTGSYTGLRIHLDDLALVAEGVSEQIDLGGAGVSLSIDFPVDVEVGLAHTLVVEVDVPLLQRPGAGLDGQSVLRIAGFTAGNAPGSGRAAQDGETDSGFGTIADR